MSDSPGLAPPGSSTYSSNTLHVGDGTWDAGRDDFLLPPLVGVNFATMRYNGMGNRFFTLTGYHPVVKAHGILAAITFLFIVPTAIFIMRFGGRRSALARQFHIWLQILTLLLSTVVIILGVFAVGPARALTNPHHGIGVAIYTLIWVQVIGGCLNYRRQKKTRSLRVSLRAMLHHWLGRAIALLGITQVALGLTLYGSPLSLFVLYALVVFAMLVLYFILEWIQDRRRAEHGSPDGSYVDTQVTREDDRHHGGVGKLAAAGAAGAGLAALFRRRSSGKQRPHSEFDSTESGTSNVSDEKDSVPPRKGWGHRLLQIGAVGGGLAAAKHIFSRKKESEDGSHVGPYRPPLGGNQSITTTDSMSQINEGRPPRPTTPLGNSPGYARPSHPLAQPPMTPGSGRRYSDDTYSDSTFTSASPSRHGRHQTFREAVTAGGTVFAVRQLLKNRRQKKDDRRADTLRKQRVEQERIQRMNSTKRYTGDGALGSRRHRHSRTNSQTASDVSNDINGSVYRPGLDSTTRIGGGEAGLAEAGLAGAGLAAASALADRDRIRPVGADPIVSPPGPASAIQSQYPPPPPPHGPDFQSSGSELYTTGSGRQRHRHHQQSAPPGASAATITAAAGPGLAAAAAARDSSRRRQSGPLTDPLESPPVSLKVKMHNDGRHVTLRRLTEEEATAQREARRRERRASASRRQNSSFGSPADSERLPQALAADERWQRTEALESQQAAQNAAAAASSAQISVLPASTPGGSQYPTPPPPGTHQGVDPQSGQHYTVPLPPPIPASTSNLGPSGSAITSQGTETSAATEYANNRRRRRAERAQARLAREGRAGGGNTVDFT